MKRSRRREEADFPTRLTDVHPALLECGDWSRLLRRRLVAVEFPCGFGHAGVRPLARAVNAPLLADASGRSTVTSPRTPKTASRASQPGRVRFSRASLSAPDIINPDAPHLPVDFPQIPCRSLCAAVSIFPSFT
ncbi:hypothetical protein LBMAG56_25210 [Verrucomicrobiota bacterium]|nr:hypothetical protein LBMAG56_25210 [Verrucomicrobiota bacterium]